MFVSNVFQALQVLFLGEDGHLTTVDEPLDGRWIAGLAIVRNVEGGMSRRIGSETFWAVSVGSAVKHI